MAKGNEIILNCGSYSIYWEPGKNLVIQSAEISEAPPPERLVVPGIFFSAIKLTTEGTNLILTPV